MRRKYILTANAFFVVSVRSLSVSLCRCQNKFEPISHIIRSGRSALHELSYDYLGLGGFLGLRSSFRQQNFERGKRNAVLSLLDKCNHRTHFIIKFHNKHVWVMHNLLLGVI